MAGFSRVILMGNLTRDPELRMTPSGTAICKFSIAISRKFKAQDGTQREEVTFVEVDAFGKQGEVVSKYFTKGKPILVEGRLRFEQWESSAGEKRSKLGVVLESFQFIGGRDNDYGSSNNQQNSYNQANDMGQQPMGTPSSTASMNDPIDIDDDVPF